LGRATGPSSPDTRDDPSVADLIAGDNPPADPQSCQPGEMAPTDPPRLTSQQLLQKAVERLQDPKVRALLVGAGLRAATAWRDRQAPVGAPATAQQARSGITRAVSDRFGQRRLERRVDNLRDALAVLGAGRPQLVERLEPVARSVENVSVALGVAGALPRARRRKAHQRIDGMLDGLETGLFEATLGTHQEREKE
jgi:hypothetical protein